MPSVALISEVGSLERLATSSTLAPSIETANRDTSEAPLGDTMPVLLDSQQGEGTLSPERGPTEDIDVSDLEDEGRADLLGDEPMVSDGTLDATVDDITDAQIHQLEGEIEELTTVLNRVRTELNEKDTARRTMQAAHEVRQT